LGAERARKGERDIERQSENERTKESEGALKSQAL